jgi:hypothetical protein
VGWWYKGRGVAVQRDNRIAETTSVVDTEIDMSRVAPGPSAIAQNVSRLLRWLMPNAHSVEPPMRSIARELEENFPSADS